VGLIRRVRDRWDSAGVAEAVFPLFNAELDRRFNEESPAVGETDAYAYAACRSRELDIEDGWPSDVYAWLGLIAVFGCVWRSVEGDAWMRVASDVDRIIDAAEDDVAEHLANAGYDSKIAWIRAAATPYLDEGLLHKTAPDFLNRTAPVEHDAANSYIKLAAEQVRRVARAQFDSEAVWKQHPVRFDTRVRIEDLFAYHGFAYCDLERGWERLLVRRPDLREEPATPPSLNLTDAKESGRPDGKELATATSATPIGTPDENHERSASVEPDQFCGKCGAERIGPLDRFCGRCGTVYRDAAP
jgi:hypothetical protein